VAADRREGRGGHALARADQVDPAQPAEISVLTLEPKPVTVLCIR
jgi:hypothetical protein